jgi:hypothetical protein
MLILGAFIQAWNHKKQKDLEEKTSSDDITGASSMKDDFSENGTLEEAGKITDSKSQNWWLSSGAYFFQEDGVGKTIQGSIEEGSKWQKKYKKNDPGETDDGFYPQNIFRLVTRNKWYNYSQEAYYKITNYNLSEDDHRSESNGLLLFNRYQDENNLYYTGLRVDGAVVIKKKYNGVYYTMAYKQIFDGKYDRESNPNLLPVNVWIGIRSEVNDNNDGTVSIKLLVDKDRSGNWKLVLETKDDGESFGGKAILDEGYAGIRTDFMDVEFDDYKITKKR